MPFIQVGGWRGGERNVTPVFAEIDEDDVEKVSKYKWGQNKSSSKHTTYVNSNTGGKKIHMHRLIMGLGDYIDDKRIIDHKDGNGLNNKKENLVICDTLYNSQSFRSHHGTRNVGCVYLDKSMTRIKRWKACFTLNGIKHQKRFLTEENAREWINNIEKE